MSFMFWGTIFLGAIGLTMAESIIVLVFGESFRESAIVMRILIWMVALSSLGCHYRYILIGYGYQKFEFMAHAIAAFASIIVGVILIPLYGEQGAAFSLVTAISIYCLIVYFSVKVKVRRIPFVPYLIKPLLAGSIMVFIFFMTNHFRFYIASCISIFSFILAMIIFQPEIRNVLSRLIINKDKTKLSNNHP
jgi:O-antigen/teichoic acid export membrane protein